MAKLGRYEVLHEIGRGGEGVVFLAIDPSIDRKVAIKTLPMAADPSGSLRAKLQKEAKATGRLNHPNIVTVYEFGVQDDVAFIAMEYVAGEPLSAIIGRGESHDHATLARYLRQAAEALDHAHSENIVHRDIKPENLMIHSRGGLKIADFGIAKVLDDATGAKTKTGVVRGTPYYLSPEQIDLTGVSGKSDQFALAVVTYEWLTGRRPFDGETWTELLTSILTKDPPPVSQYRESLGEPVTAVLLKALSKSPANRYETCLEFALEMAKALGVAPIAVPKVVPENTIPAVPAVVPDPPAPVVAAAAPPNRSAVYVGIGLALAAVLAAAVYWNRGEASTPTVASQQQPQAQQAAAKSLPTDPPPTPVESKERPEPRPTESKEMKPKETAKKKDTPVPPPTKAKPTQEPEPAPVREVAVPKPVEPPPPPIPAGKYFGPPEGRFTWQGNVAPGAEISITGSSASAGTIAGGGLPRGVDVIATVDPPAMQAVVQPNAASGYRLTLKNSSAVDVQTIVIKWKERAKQ